VLRVENVRGWRVVDDDSVFEVSANLRQVLHESAPVTGCTCDALAYLHVVALVVVATFAEKPVVHNTMDIELVE
jgi:hypothetical protein